MKKSTAPLLSLCALLAVPLIFAGPAEAQFYRQFQYDRYKDCVRQVSINAEQAFATADQWWKKEGMAAALHCKALALSEMEVYPSAAKALERLAVMDQIEKPVHRAEIYEQAGHAWMLADRADEAREDFDKGLGFVTLQSHPLVASELMVAKAHAWGLEEKWDKAIDILNEVLEVLPQQYDALLLRASMLRAEGDIPGAARDLAAYLVMMPDEVDGLMERGFLRMEILDLKGAQADFEKVMAVAPESKAALQAQEALSKIAFRLRSEEESGAQDFVLTDPETGMGDDQ